MIAVEGKLASLLPGLGVELAEVAARLRASVVAVRSDGYGGGSGVIWERNGLIVTNHHVVARDSAAVVFEDGRTLPARVVARDPQMDLAALRVDAVGLPAVSVRDTATLRVGEIVLAVGNPLGIRGVVTAGIVSGPGRNMPLDGRGAREMVQADVELLPGNSGGALADVAGRLIGINAMVAAPGIALAVPSAAVVQFLGQGGGERGYLGIEGTPVVLPAALAGRLGMTEALMLTGVRPNSPAERAGLLVGDILLQIDGRPLRGIRELVAGLDRAIGQPLSVALLRAGRWQELLVVPEKAA